jgi:hypothetical protein
MRAQNALRNWHLFFLITAIGASSCTDGDRAREWMGSVQDSAGIRLVSNPEEGLWCPGGEWTFTDGLTIGADVGDPTYEFGKITGIQVGRPWGGPR